MKYTLACWVALSLVAPASGDILSGDSEFGPDTVTIDTDLNLMFLDLTVTESLSFDQVRADPTYAGWRHASFDEVRAMWLHAGLEDWTGSSYSGPGLSNGPGVSAEVLALVELVGGTVVRADFGGTLYYSAVGMTSDVTTSGRIRATELYAHPLATEYGLLFSFLSDEQSDASGHWLVRVVPSPGPVTLAALTLLTASRRRRSLNLVGMTGKSHANN